MLGRFCEDCGHERYAAMCDCGRHVCEQCAEKWEMTDSDVETDGGYVALQRAKTVVCKECEEAECES